MDRQAFLDAAERLAPYVTADAPGGVRLVVSTRDAGGRQLFTRPSAASAGLRRALDQIGHLSARDTFVDAGAGVGAVTIAAVSEHSFRRVVACEPVPEAFRLLRVNLLANDVADRVVALQVLPSDGRGHARLAVDGPDWGAWRPTTLKEAAAAGARRPPSVARSSVDAVLAAQGIDPHSVAIVRIRCPGHSVEALAGATETIRSGAAVIVESPPSRGRALDRAIKAAGASPARVADAVLGLPRSA